MTFIRVTALPFAVVLCALQPTVSFCQATDAGSLGRAFRPQEAPPPPPAARAASAPVAVGTARSEGASSGLRVVVLAPNRSLAFIDGKIVRRGDLVNGMRVADISERGVVLVGEDGAREHLRLTPAAVKREHPAAAAQNSNSKEYRP